MKSLLDSNIGTVLGNTLINIARSHYLSFKIKIQKIVNLIKRKRKSCKTNCSVPVINLSNYNLLNQEIQQLKIGLDYFFVDRNKDFWRFLQLFTKYLRLTPVSMWYSALREKFNFCFSTVFCYDWQNFHFGRKTGH